MKKKEKYVSPEEAVDSSLNLLLAFVCLVCSIGLAIVSPEKYDTYFNIFIYGTYFNIFIHIILPILLLIGAIYLFIKEW